jgi:hypothetical protein
MSEQTQSERRQYIRIPARIPVEWSEDRAGRGRNEAPRRSEITSVCGMGFSLRHTEEISTGTRVSATASAGPVILSLEGVVVECHADSPDGYVVGVRCGDSCQGALRALLLEAYETLDAHSCICATVRHCGEQQAECPAANSRRNCWQVEDAACCYWSETRDCVSCPVSLLAFVV